MAANLSSSGFDWAPNRSYPLPERTAKDACRRATKNRESRTACRETQTSHGDVHSLACAKVANKQEWKKYDSINFKVDTLNYKLTTCYGGLGADTPFKCGVTKKCVTYRVTLYKDGKDTNEVCTNLRQCSRYKWFQKIRPAFTESINRFDEGPCMML